MIKPGIHFIHSVLSSSQNTVESDAQAAAILHETIYEDEEYDDPDNYKDEDEPEPINL